MHATHARDEAALREQMQGLSFYHTIALTDTLSTPGWPVVVPIVEMTRSILRKLDLHGKRVLDIGCRDGLFCFEAERLGASEVIGIDNDLSPGVTEFLIRTLNSRVTIQSLNLFDLRPQTFGTFDVVIFPGVLYHLRYPFWALRLIRSVLKEGGQLLVETAVLADDNQRAMLFCPTGAESPYEPTSCTFYNRKGLTDSLTSLGFEVQETECLLKLPEKALTGTPSQTPIDRCTMLCRKARSSREDIELYWEGTRDVQVVPTWDKADAAFTPRRPITLMPTLRGILKRIRNTIVSR